jgi:hypothetical protein
MAPQSESLKVKLREYTKCYIGPAAEFLPQDTLQRLITEENVTSILGNYGFLIKTFRPRKYSDGLNLVSLVTGKSRAIFAILVILDKSQFAKKLLTQNGLRDHHLPLAIDRHPTCKSSDAERKEISFLNWSQPDLMDFVDRTQWLFLAPVLEANGKTISLHEKCPLPFIGDGDDDPASGGGGIVYRARVHPAHQRGFEVSKKFCYTWNLQSSFD